VRKSTAKASWVLWSWGAKRGSKLRIRVEGPDAPEALRQIERLISSFEEGGDTIEAQDILDRPKLDAVDKLRTRSRRGQDSSKQGRLVIDYAIER
jgi:PTS HPr component phosphorylation site